MNTMTGLDSRATIAKSSQCSQVFSNVLKTENEKTVEIPTVFLVNLVSPRGVETLCQVVSEHKKLLEK